MGAEFFNRNKGSIKKCRERQKKRLENELPPIVKNVSVVAIKVMAACTLRKGQKFELTLENKILRAYHERSLIGFSNELGAKLVDDIKRAGGRAVGTYDRYLRMSNQLNLAVSVDNSNARTEKVQSSTTSR